MIIDTNERKICTNCGKNPRSINYKKNGITYYRSLCNHCITQNMKKRKPRWICEGYSRKLTCEACSFVPKFDEQLIVIEYKNNFKTICLNCEVAVKIANRLDIKKGDLKPDF